MKKKKNAGFTLIELLATIAVLAIITGITLYIALNSVNKAKQKSYEITLNEVSKQANAYVKENSSSDKIFFVQKGDTNTEQQCIKVKELMEAGYLKNDVTDSNISKDKKVDPENYILLERNRDTKVITKSEYITEDNNNVCGNLVTAEGDIIITSNPAFNEWSKFKNITIEYMVKSNKNENKTFSYEYNDIHSSKDRENPKKFTATENGTLIAKISGFDEKKVNDLENIKEITKTKAIEKIDGISPKVTSPKKSGDKINIKNNKVTIPLNIYDMLDATNECKGTDEGKKCSGLDKSSVTKDDFIVTIDGTQVSINDIKIEQTTGNSNYNLVVSNITKEGTLNITVNKDTIFDLATNGNDKTEINGLKIVNRYKITFDPNGGYFTTSSWKNNPTKEVIYGGTYGELPTKNDLARTQDTSQSCYNCDEYTKYTYTYKFAGWYTGKNKSGASIDANDTVKITKDTTLYAGWNTTTTTEEVTTKPASSSSESGKIQKCNTTTGTLEWIDSDKCTTFLFWTSCESPYADVDDSACAGGSSSNDCYYSSRTACRNANSGGCGDCYKFDGCYEYVDSECEPSSSSSSSSGGGGTDLCGGHIYCCDTYNGEKCIEPVASCVPSIGCDSQSFPCSKCTCSWCKD